jgi:hypothetical protein
MNTEDFFVGVSEPRLPQIPGQYANSHCKEISIYVFPEKELRGLSPIFHIHVSVSRDRSTYFFAAE